MAKFDYKGGDYRQIAVAYTLEELVAQLKVETKSGRKDWLLGALSLKHKVEAIWAKQTPENQLKAINDAQQDF